MEIISNRGIRNVRISDRINERVLFLFVTLFWLAIYNADLYYYYLINLHK